MKNPLRTVVVWWLQSAKLRELISQRDQHLGAADRRLLAEAQSSMLVAWRIMAGLEPISSSFRGTVAAPLLAAAFDKSRKVIAPTRTNFAELLQEAEWQERFTNAGLSESERTAIGEWLSSESIHELPLNVAKSALIALRAALDSVDAPRRAIRALRWRRVLVFAVFVALVVGIPLGVQAVLRGPGPPDIAAGKPWNASSAYLNYTISGLKPVKPTAGMFFSTVDEYEPWWRVDLQGSFEISSLEIVNRSDCCGDRPWPLVVELSSDEKVWREVARQSEQVSTWKPTFKASAARYVRLRSLSRTLLHLKDVKVYGTPKKK